MVTKAILNLIPTMQSIALLSENVKVAKKKKVSTGDLVGLGAKNIIGIEFIKIESNLIGMI